MLNNETILEAGFLVFGISRTPCAIQLLQETLICSFRGNTLFFQTRQNTDRLEKANLIDKHDSITYRRHVVHTYINFVNQVDGGLKVKAKVNIRPVNVFLAIFLLLNFKHGMVEELLKHFICIVDAKLLKAVNLCRRSPSVSIHWFVYLL